jgi:hypothetical protein
MILARMIHLTSTLANHKVGSERAQEGFLTCVSGVLRHYGRTHEEANDTARHCIR